MKASTLTSFVSNVRLVGNTYFKKEGFRRCGHTSNNCIAAFSRFPSSERPRWIILVVINCNVGFHSLARRLWDARNEDAHWKDAVAKAISKRDQAIWELIASYTPRSIFMFREYRRSLFPTHPCHPPMAQFKSRFILSAHPKSQILLSPRTYTHPLLPRLLIHDWIKVDHKDAHGLPTPAVGRWRSISSPTGTRQPSNPIVYPTTSLNYPLPHIRDTTNPFNFIGVSTALPLRTIVSANVSH
jgi:hypothetical protein